MDTLQILTNLIQDNAFVTIGTAVVTVFSVISAAVPAPKEGTFWAKAFKLVSVLAVNVGNAKNQK